MARDEDWFHALYNTHRAAIVAYCARRVGVADAQDAAAEVFSTAWRRRQDMPPPGRELPWLYGVARYVVSHRWRSAARSRRLIEKAAATRRRSTSGPDEIVIERAEHQAVRAALDALRPNDREVLLLSAWEGLSHREIAEVVGCSLAAVDKRITRARQRLADKYNSMDRSRSLLPAERQNRGGR